MSRKQSTTKETPKDKEALVNKVLETYHKVENGSIDLRDFRKIITNDLKIKPTEEFDFIVNSANKDKKTFPEIMRSLKILKNEARKQPNFSEEQIKSSTQVKFHRYIKEKEKRIKGFEEKDEVKYKAKKLLSGEINTKDFTSALRENNINPECDEVNKLIRAVENSQTVKYKDLIFAITCAKGGKAGSLSNQLNFEYEVPRGKNKVIDDTDKARSMIVCGNNPVYLPKKKTLEKDPNYQSVKEGIYEYKKNALNSDEKFTKIPFKLKNQNESGEIKVGRVPAYADHGNILLQGSHELDEPKVTLKRKDPNVKSNKTYEKPVVIKNLRLFKESSDNAHKFI